MDAKYVILDKTYPVVFSGNIEHKRMAELGNVTSAGFVKFEGASVHCYGKSHSLDIGSGPGDEDLIKIFFRIGRGL